MRAAGTVGMIGQLPGAGLAPVGTTRSLWRSGVYHSAINWVVDLISGIVRA
jgi:hypothetical protein